jgi:hypothetical protein
MDSDTCTSMTQASPTYIRGRAPAHVLVKKGVVVVAVTLPENPSLHKQPEGTLVPVEFAGHDTPEQPATEYGPWPATEHEMAEKTHTRQNNLKRTKGADVHTAAWRT